jgi:NAD(P)-dependent dehydrogenase (short-subunit alcohol dehydrogenase family)
VTVSFAGRVVIVTGSGRGLGRAYALDFARLGAAVVVNSRPPPTPGEPSSASLVAAEITAAGGQAFGHTGSVADPAGAAGIVDAALDRFGRVDAVVNNAGTTHRADLADVTPEDLDAQVASHVIGAILVCKRVFEAMRAAGYGRVVLTGSHAAMFGRSQAAAYAPAMASVVGISNALAIEGEPHGILVNTVLPVAATRTPAQSWAIRESPEAIAAKPFSHRLTVEFVAPLVTFLASDACTATKGMYAAVGGRYMRVFTGVTRGWCRGDDLPPSPDEIAEHWDDIRDERGSRVAATTLEEFTMLSALEAERARS